MSVYRTVCIMMVIGSLSLQPTYHTASDGELSEGLGTRLGTMGYLGVLSESDAEFPDVLCGGIQKLLIACPRLPSLILPLKVVTNLL